MSEPQEESGPEEATRIIDLPPRQRGKAMAYQIWQTDDLGFDLTVEEQLFVRSYIIDRDEVSALKRLGYDEERPKLKRMADRLLRSTNVQDAIAKMAKEMMAKLEISAENVNRAMADIAFFDLTDIMEFDGVSYHMLPTKFWPSSAKTALKSVKHGQFGLNIEFHDKGKALDFFAKQTGLSETEEAANRAQAEAAATQAITKVMEVVGRVQNMKQAKLVEQKDDEDE